MRREPHPPACHAWVRGVILTMEGAAHEIFSKSVHSGFTLALRVPTRSLGRIASIWRRCTRPTWRRTSILSARISASRWCVRSRSS